MRRLIRLYWLAGATLFATGCATRALFIDPGMDVVRLDADVTGHVFVYQNGQWVRSSGKVQLPAGWYAGYLPPN